ncbi:hypothetical protein FRC01_000513 [Tulasnella sp. 417]|nr:hypothetical protein FRC01_000513 [Tulasnella sp. 417]
MQSAAGSSSEEKRLIRRVDELRRAVFRTQHKKEQENAIQECAKLIPSQYLEVNRSAISLLVNVFREHDDLQATIINKAYDMAEEAQLELRWGVLGPPLGLPLNAPSPLSPDCPYSSLQVRYQAVDFIVDLSRQSPKWTSRNADVLIQLLAADSEDADKIYQSITSHLTIEPAATLRTICRFLDPADPDINTTPELRSKLYAYLVAQDLGRLDRPILQGFREGLIKAIPSSSFTELSVMIHDLLLPYLVPNEQELPLINALLQRALAFLKVPPFDSAAVMGVTKGARNLVIKLGSPIALRLELLSFFSAPEVLSSRIRFDPQVQTELLKFLGESLDIPMNDLDDASENSYLEYRNNVADDLKGWAKVLLTCRDQLWETAVPLLQTVLDRRRDDPQWQPDGGALERLGDRLSSPNLPQAVLQQTKLAKLIINDINAVRTVPQIAPRATQPAPRPAAVPPGVQPLKSYGPPPKRKAEDPPMRPKDPPTQPPAAMMGIKGAAAGSARNGDARPPIKAQASRDAPPASLLQRLALDRTSSSSSVSEASGDPSNPGGKAHERPSKRRRQDEGADESAPASRPGSLFSRIHQPSSSPGTPTSKQAQPSSPVPTPASASGKIGFASAQNGSNPLSAHARSTASAPPTPVGAAVPSANQFRKDTILDLDANDEEVAKKYGPFGNMTSNQAIIFNELSRPNHDELVLESARQALRDIEQGVEKDSAADLTVDWMTAKLGAEVLPHLDVKGFALAQTNPSQARDTEATVRHARRMVRLFERAGVPSSRVCIKIPATLEGLRASRILSKEHNINTLATTVFCVEQALAAAEEAGCLFTSPYVNPLEVHFVPGSHVVYADPITEMRGMKATAEIQRQFRRRGVATKVLAASLITIEETLSLSGVDRATLGPTMLEMLQNEKDSERFQKLRERAIQSYSPDFQVASDLPLDAHFPLDEPATALKAALSRPDIEHLITDALAHFTRAEKGLIVLAEKALADVQK